MLILSIPKPCHENWNEMSPREQGAFCKVCAKRVVDFTLLSDDEVKNYFLENSNQKTCGRFRNDQLAEPGTLQELLLRPIPFWKKFLAIVLLLFGTFLNGCQSSTLGKIKASNSITLGTPEPDYITTGVTITEMIPDTSFIEVTSIDDHCSAKIDIVDTEIIGEIAPITSCDTNTIRITIIKEIDVKVDSVKKSKLNLLKIDSLKEIIRVRDCDTLPIRPIEP